MSMYVHVSLDVNQFLSLIKLQCLPEVELSDIVMFSIHIKDGAWSFTRQEYDPVKWHGCSIFENRPKSNLE